MAKMKQNTNYDISILSPGGNQTALVKGIVPKRLRRNINDQIMVDFPDIEQVGFYNFNSKLNKARLVMAGGEFCGNATRSLAYLLLKGKKGEISVNVSGANETLRTGVENKNYAWAEMPSIKNFNIFSEISTGLYVLKIPGIIFLITDQSKKIKEDYLKRTAKSLLKKAGLLYSQKASGVIFLRRNPNENDSISIEPIVWVRDVNTMFRETACASGSTAAAIYLLKTQGAQSPFTIKQPSREILTINLKENKKSIKATVSGPIKIIQ